MATTDIHFDNFKIYRSAKECILRLQIQQWSTFMSAAPLDSGYFDQKLRDPSLLILRSSFSYGRSCRTLFHSNSVLPFFEKELKKAMQKHTWLFGTWRPWLPWETADPWDLLLRPSFFCGRNSRTLVGSNLELPFFDGAF